MLFVLSNATRVILGYKIVMIKDQLVSIKDVVILWNRGDEDTLILQPLSEYKNGPRLTQCSWGGRNTEVKDGDLEQRMSLVLNRMFILIHHYKINPKTIWAIFSQIKEYDNLEVNLPYLEDYGDDS